MSGLISGHSVLVPKAPVTKVGFQRAGWAPQLWSQVPAFKRLGLGDIP